MDFATLRKQARALSALKTPGIVLSAPTLHNHPPGTTQSESKPCRVCMIHGNPFVRGAWTVAHRAEGARRPGSAEKGA